MEVRRLLPLSGIVSVVLLVMDIVALGGDTPESKASAAELSAFYGDENVRQGIAAFLLAATAPFLVLFASALAAHLGLGGHQQRPVWERVVLAGAAITAAATVVAALIHFALADGADNKAPLRRFRR